MRIMKTHNQGLMFDYPDKTNGQRNKIGYMLNKK